MKRILKNLKVQVFIIGLFFLGIGVFFTPLSSLTLPEKKQLESNSNTYMASKSSDFLYLSDIAYIEGQSKAGWKTITYDKNLDGGLINLILEGSVTPFFKGITAHATSIVVYDISQYNYDYFTSYIGVDASLSGRGNGVKFYIYTSVDGKNWNLKTDSNPEVLSGKEECKFISVDIRGAKFLKLYASDNGGNAADHSVYANAKLIKEGYREETLDFIKPVSEYDKIIKGTDLNQQLSKNELTLLQRNFVKSMGYTTLQAYGKQYEDYRETINWIMNDIDALRLYVTGGKPTGNYPNSLKILVNLYQTYKNDLTNEGVTKYGTKLGDLYKRMIITLSLTHSANVCAWYGGNQCSNPVTRYAIYKSLHERELLENKIFETLSVEEMRWVMNNQIADEEIEWLNAWARKFPVTSGSRKGPYNREPYRYIRYTFGYNYNRPQYYDELKYKEWDEKYNLSAYNITYQTGKPKIWIVFEEGGVCGATSKLGSNLNAVFGYPTAVIGQPGHAAYLEYWETDDGKGYWGIQNNISGWTKSEKSERLLMGWGSNNWDSYYQVSYVPYGQEAINDLESYEKATKILLLIDVYKEDIEKQEKIYRKALEYQAVNMDAWYGLIRNYQANGNKTEKEYYELAVKLTKSMKCFPLPMWDLLHLFNNIFTSAEYKVKYTLLEREALEAGLAVTEADGVLQPSITKTMANYLLGNNDFSIASFSFDGKDAGMIVLSDKFQDTTVNFEYSIDGKQTWKQSQDKKTKLSKEEIEKINESDDIVIHLVGSSSDDIYTIDIRRQEAPSMIYNNDLENKVIGATEQMEWRMDESSDWTSFKDSEPDLMGDKTVYVRIGKTGIFLESPELELKYTKDIVDDKRKYVPISHLSIDSVSTEATGQGRYAKNAIDGNYYTNWHSAWNGTDTQRYITIKLDRPMYISAVEFVPAGGGNGKILDGTIYGSVDGEKFEVLTSVKNLANNETIKKFEIENLKQVQYVKIVADRASNGNWFTARMFNLFQDITKQPAPTPTPTGSPMPTPTPTGSPMPTPTPTGSPMPTPTPTGSPTPTPTGSPMPTPTPTGSPMPTPTPTGSPMPTPTPTGSPMPTPTPTGSPMPTPTPTGSPMPTPTPSKLPTSTPNDSSISNGDDHYNDNIPGNGVMTDHTEESNNQFISSIPESNVNYPVESKVSTDNNQIFQFFLYLFFLILGAGIVIIIL